MCNKEAAQTAGFVHGRCQTRRQKPKLGLWHCKNCPGSLSKCGILLGLPKKKSGKTTGFVPGFSAKTTCLCLAFVLPPLRFALCWFFHLVRVETKLSGIDSDMSRRSKHVAKCRSINGVAACQHNLNESQWVHFWFKLFKFCILREREKEKIHIYHIKTFVKTCIVYTSTGLVMTSSTCIYDTRLAMQLDSGPVRRRSTHGIRSLVPCRHWALSKFDTSLRDGYRMKLENFRPWVRSD